MAIIQDQIELENMHAQSMPPPFMPNFMADTFEGPEPEQHYHYQHQLQQQYTLDRPKGLSDATAPRFCLPLHSEDPYKGQNIWESGTAIIT